MTRSKSTPLDLLQTMMRASISQPNCSLMRVSLSPLVVMLHPTFSNGGAPSLTQCNWYCRTRYGRSFSVNSYRLTSDVDPAPIGLPSQSFPNRFVPRLFALSYPAATPSYLGLSLALYLLRKTSRGKRLIRRAEIPKSLPLFQHSRTPRVNVLQACDVIPSDSPLTPTSSFDLLLWGEDPTSRVTQTLSSFRGDIFVNYPQLGYFIDGFFTPALQLRF
jgi:hypothetical protein